MGRYLGQYGLPPMAGRMWGWLLVCDPVEQTAGQLAEALHASRGSISGTGRMLSPLASSAAPHAAATGVSTSAHPLARSAP